MRRDIITYLKEDGSELSALAKVAVSRLDQS